MEPEDKHTKSSALELVEASRGDRAQTATAGCARDIQKKTAMPLVGLQGFLGQGGSGCVSRGGRAQFEDGIQEEGGLKQESIRARECEWWGGCWKAV